MNIQCRLVLSVLLTLFVPRLTAQQASPPVGVPADVASAEIGTALAGDWTGVLEYRDFSEPPTSTKRVKLPTWLTVVTQRGALRFQYTYDDGPGKTVFNTELVTIDAGAGTWTIVPDPPKQADGKPDSLVIAGLADLKAGRGTLVLTGVGTESGKPVDIRTTLLIGRNLLQLLRETRPPGGEFRFRDAYTFVRSLPPHAAAADAAKLVR